MVRVIWLMSYVRFIVMGVILTKIESVLATNQYLAMRIKHHAESESGTCWGSSSSLSGTR